PPALVHAVAQERRPRYVGFEVSTSLPPELADLEPLARNYWWSWDPEAQGLFRSISERMWRESDRNPLTFLSRVYPSDAAARARDPEFLARLRRVVDRFRAYVEADPLDGWDGAPLSPRHPVAYFSLEFGVHPSLRVYSGGLGILAGDHLKSASDLRLPLVGVGLFYRRGYVRQELAPGGEQLSLDSENDPRALPIELVRDAAGAPLSVVVHLTGAPVALQVWRASVGRVPLFLLDADVEGNRPEDRALTARLYGGGIEDRIRQEILLGKGGVRLLELLDVEPRVVHMNEGHAAFAALERASRLVHEQGLTFDEAREVVRATTAFTTHTPVPAGHDVFSEDLMRRHFPDCERWIGLPWEKFMALGQQADGRFNMTYLSLSMAGWVNGVARKHGEVSRALLHAFWPGLAVDEVPVGHVTNGVHLATWVRPGIARVLGVAERAVRPDDFAAGAAAL
ncbi:MAG TPA: alpha-glucan family phosphorylase, partial [Planctomycetota bacterium]|nr:alpha-glucan family phosphorylase [Planctomycetota bacterium]